MNIPVTWSNATRKRLVIAIACGFLLVLPSCGIPDLRPPNPGPGVAESFDGVTSPDSSAQVRIEEFFRDPLLRKLICQALVGNQELRILGEDVQIASNEILSRQGAYLPFLSPGASAGISKFSTYSLEGASIRDDPYLPGRFLPNPLPKFLLGPVLFWTPDIWNQLHNAKDAAAMRYYATAEGRNAFVTRLVAEIADNYYRLLGLDKRLQILDQNIAVFEESLRVARLNKVAALDTELPIQRFLAELYRIQSEKRVVNQDIIEAENRINFLVGRNAQRVERRVVGDFLDLNLHPLSVGVPAQLLLNRPDIRQAERELAATGLDVLVARKRFYPQGFVNAGVGYEALNPRYLFLTPEALVGQVAGNLLVPLINRKAIKADYLTANARQLQAVYNYQRVILEAYIEVINRLARAENFRRSVEFRKQQLASLNYSVEVALKLFRAALIDYLDVLTVQRDLREATLTTLENKQQQLSAIVNTYQALGGGAYLFPILKPAPLLPRHPWWDPWRHTEVRVPAVLPPGPPPAPAAIGRPGPPAPAAERAPEPPSTPAVDRGPEPPPTPAPEGGPQPPPAPDLPPALPPTPVAEPPPPQA